MGDSITDAVGNTTAVKAPTGYDWQWDNGISVNKYGTFLRSKDGNPIQIKTPQSGLVNGLQTGSQIVGALASGMNAYTGWKGLGLAEDEFNFTKAANNRDIANQAKLVNNDIQNASEVGLALGGGVMSDQQIAASRAAAAARQVDGSAIG